MQKDKIDEQGSVGLDSKNVKTEIQVTMPVESEKLLALMLSKVNEGFELGRVTRKDLIAFLIERASVDFSEDQILQLRKAHVDDVSLLEAALKNARKTGSLPPDLKKVLWNEANTSLGVKRVKKVAAKNHFSPEDESEEPA